MSVTSDGTVQADNTPPGAEHRQAGAVTPRALRVWSWWGYEPSIHKLLVFVAAATSRQELNRTCARLDILTPGHVTYLRSHESGFIETMRNPGQVLWVPLDNYGRHPHHWFLEDQLTAARSSATAPPTGPSLIFHRRVGPIR